MIDPQYVQLVHIHFIMHCSTTQAQAASTTAHRVLNTTARAHLRMGSIIQAPQVLSTTAAPPIGALQATRMENITQVLAQVSSSSKLTIFMSQCFNQTLRIRSLVDTT